MLENENNTFNRKYCALYTYIYINYVHTLHTTNIYMAYIHILTNSNNFALNAVAVKYMITIISANGLRKIFKQASLAM